MTAPLEILSVAEMTRCDQAAVKAGTPGAELMLRAGSQVAAELVKRWTQRPTVVLCGPGNNGGDGFVVARVLAGLGWPVRVALLGLRERLTGDAAAHAARWTGPVEPLEPRSIDGVELVVDALFGAGLSRAIGDDLGQIFAALHKRGVPVVAIDVPSGVHGDSGQAMGNPPQAALTVTFCRKKPAHLLLPGRALCGEIVVADIGIADAIVTECGATALENAPELWRHVFPRPRPGDHKYSRGHAIVVGGAHMTGAARLAARAAMRIGAGIVTLASPADMVVHYMGWLPHVVVKPVRDTAAFAEMLAERRAAAALVGPGNGLVGGTRERALAALAARKPCVLDADALSVFEHTVPLLQQSLHDGCVLTPHDGEFERLFTHRDGGRLQRAQAAARQSGAVILFKGYDTVIAHPDGRAVINANAPATLATAGAGDVLAGMVVGLLAQGMPPFEAACAAVWLHGEAAASFGPGLVSEDLPDLLPAALRHVRAVM
ncbi:MAG: NAD(P)H-hydrate dehydratase [Alphaproteobacteria bacterium]|nr:NAD(P)H-hydrate dehydratase [Alphaproteobacteria bacterium]